MEVKYLILCEKATNYQNGTFSVLNGGIFKIAGMTFPFLAPITVLIHAHADHTEQGSHKVVLSARDENGNIIENVMPNGKKMPISIEAQLNLQIFKDSPKDEPVAVTLPLTMPIVFDRPGHFQIRCDINGKAHTTPLIIAQAQQVI